MHGSGDVGDVHLGLRMRPGRLRAHRDRAGRGRVDPRSGQVHLDDPDDPQPPQHGRVVGHRRERGVEIEGRLVHSGHPVYVKRSASDSVLSPASVVWTTTCTSPAVPAGETALSEVPVTEVGVTAVPPKVTEVALARLVPVTVTVVPPAAGPVFGLSAVTVGFAR